MLAGRLAAIATHAIPKIAEVVHRLWSPIDSKYRNGNHDRPQVVAFASKAATAQEAAVGGEEGRLDLIPTESAPEPAPGRAEERDRQSSGERCSNARRHQA